MPKVLSTDGTAIAFEQFGEGPPLILVVGAFNTRSELVGIPDEIVAQLRHAPFRPALEAIAHTLVYDATIVGDRSLPTALAGAVTTPTLVIAGDASAPFMRVTAQALADALPNGQVQILEGQTHDIQPSALGPVLQAFLAQ